MLYRISDVISEQKTHIIKYHDGVKVPRPQHNIFKEILRKVEEMKKEPKKEVIE